MKTAKVIVIIGYALLCLLCFKIGYAGNLPEERPPTITPMEPIFYASWATIDVADEIAEEKDYKLSDLTIISDKGDKAQMKLYGSLTILDAAKLWDDFFILTHNTEIRDVDIQIASPGGSTYGGFSIIAQIKKAKKDGFKITAYGTSMVGSMAIPIFAVCEYRVTYPSTIFMVHPATIQNPAAMTETDMESQAAFHKMTKDIYVSVLAEYTNLSKEEWLLKIKTDTWFSAKQAKEWGLVDEIR